jgi:hypothetical protein
LEGLASGSPAGKSGSSRRRLALGTGGDGWVGSEATSVPSEEADERGGRTDGCTSSELEAPDFESGEVPDDFVMGSVLHQGKSERREDRANKSLLVTLGLMLFPFCQVVINLLTQVDITVAGDTVYITNAE